MGDQAAENFSGPKFCRNLIFVFLFPSLGGRAKLFWRRKFPGLRCTVQAKAIWGAKGSYIIRLYLTMPATMSSSGLKDPSPRWSVFWLLNEPRRPTSAWIIACMDSSACMVLHVQYQGIRDKATPNEIVVSCPKFWRCRCGRATILKSGRSLRKMYYRTSWYVK